MPTRSVAPTEAFSLLLERRLWDLGRWWGRKLRMNACCGLLTTHMQVMGVWTRESHPEQVPPANALSAIWPPFSLLSLRTNTNKASETQFSANKRFDQKVKINFQSSYGKIPTRKSLIDYSLTVLPRSPQSALLRASENLQSFRLVSTISNNILFPSGCPGIHEHFPKKFILLVVSAGFSGKTWI